MSYFLGELLSGGLMPGELLSTDLMSNQCLSTPVIYMWASLPSPTCVHARACIYDIHIWRCSLTAEAVLCERIQNVNWRERQGECMGECVCLCGVFSMSVLLKIVCHVAVVCIQRRDILLLLTLSPPQQQHFNPMTLVTWTVEKVRTFSDFSYMDS